MLDFELMEHNETKIVFIQLFFNNLQDENKNKSNQKVKKKCESFKIMQEKINHINVIQKLLMLFQTNLSRQIHIVSTHSIKWNH